MAVGQATASARANKQRSDAHRNALRSVAERVDYFLCIAVQQPAEELVRLDKLFRTKHKRILLPIALALLLLLLMLCLLLLCCNRAYGQAIVMLLDFEREKKFSSRSRFWCALLYY